MATLRMKQEKSDSRVIGHFSPEIRRKNVPTLSRKWKAIRENVVMVRRNRGIPGSKVSHAVQWCRINWGEAVYSVGLVWGRRYAGQLTKANGMQAVGWPDSTGKGG